MTNGTNDDVRGITHSGFQHLTSTYTLSEFRFLRTQRQGAPRESNWHFLVTARFESGLRISYPAAFSLQTTCEEQAVFACLWHRQSAD